MNLSQIPLALLVISLVSLINCKKEPINPFQHQEGIYIGSRHFQSIHFIYHYYPIAFDSITLEPTEFTEYYEPIEVDTTFIDTVSVEIFKDSILFDTYLHRLKFAIEEDNIYKIASLGAAGIELKYIISGDTFKISHYYLIDKNSNYSGNGVNNFIGIKQ